MIYQYLLRRAGMGLAALVAVTAGAFLLTVAAQGDPAILAIEAGGGEPTPELVAQYRAQLGLDQPLVLRYITWFGNVIQGDLGTSFMTRRPVAAMIAERLVATLSLGLITLVVSTLAGTALGIWLATMRSRRLELGSRTLLLVAACIPGFWMALGLLVIVANWLPFIPVAGYGSPANYLLPVIVLGLAPSALLIRLVRSSIREQLGMDYVRTARSRGIGNRSIVFRHVMPGIVAPVIALTGVRLGAILTGSIIIEPIFAWPGIGSLVIASISGRDLPVLAGVLLLVAVAVVVANLLADLAIAAIDPRVRWGAQIGVSR